MNAKNLDNEDGKQNALQTLASEIATLAASRSASAQVAIKENVSREERVSEILKINIWIIRKRYLLFYFKNYAGVLAGELTGSDVTI